MCGRFYVGGDFRDKLNTLMEAEGIAPARTGQAGASALLSVNGSGRDVFPSNASSVICGERGTGRLVAAEMHWGFANPYRKGLIINARAETAKQKRLFADSVMARRCVIPASGFYEWDPYKARFRFTAPDGGLVLLAGFYHEEQGEPRYTILTTEANDSMRPVHDRMPVMISRDEIRPWITDSDRVDEFLERPQVRLEREQDSGQIRMEFDL